MISSICTGDGMFPSRSLSATAAASAADDDDDEVKAKGDIALASFFLRCRSCWSFSCPSVYIYVSGVQ